MDSKKRKSINKDCKTRSFNPFHWEIKKSKNKIYIDSKKYITLYLGKKIKVFTKKR